MTDSKISPANGTEIVLASSNPGKLNEFNELLAPLGFTVTGQAALGVSDAEETGTTFLENALLKARHAAAETARPAIADDSGLVVPALGGAPGIYSARYAGSHGDDAANNKLLLENLRHHEGSDRNAYFYCALVWVNSADDPAPLVGLGAWHGRILAQPRGNNGFGYDPLFEVASLAVNGNSVSSAELPSTEKNRLSHRAQALNELLKARAAFRSAPGP